MEAGREVRLGRLAASWDVERSGVGRMMEYDKITSTRAAAASLPTRGDTNEVMVHPDLMPVTQHRRISGPDRYR